jgi:hypothetical protein
VSLLVFRETAQLRSLLIGLPLLAAAVWLAESAGGKKPSGPG